MGKLRKVLYALLISSSMLFSLSASASAIFDGNAEIPAEPKSQPYADTKTESSTEAETTTEAPTEAETTAEASTEAETTKEASTEAETTTEVSGESEGNVAPPTNDAGNDAVTEGKDIPTTGQTTDIFVTQYRMYHGKAQYRRWNQTKARWEDPVWLDGSVSGVNKIVLYSGKTMKLSLGFVKPKYASKRVYWKSKKPRIVYAHKNGRIIAKKSGIAQVNAINRKTKRPVAKVKIIVRKG